MSSKISKEAPSLNTIEIPPESTGPPNSSISAILSISSCASSLNGGTKIKPVLASELPSPPII